MRKLFIIALFLAALLPAPARNNTSTNQAVIHILANPNATAEARKVYDILWSLYGHKAVSGVVANVGWNIKEAENVYSWTGKCAPTTASATLVRLALSPTKLLLTPSALTTPSRTATSKWSGTLTKWRNTLARCRSRASLSSGVRSTRA